MNQAFINGIILDGTENMVPQSNKIILTDDNLITAIVSRNHDLRNYEIVDLKGQYIMPGLINLHVHLPASGKPKKKPSDPKKMVEKITSSPLMNKIGIRLCEGYAKTELYSGVTTIRTVGGITNYDTTIRNKINEGQIAGPRILASNMAISVPGGHMAGSLAYEAHNPEEATHFVEEISKDNPDLIKLMITGGVMDAEVVGEPGVLRMSPEIVKAACDRAHQLGFKVAAHVESPEGVKVALENGVDSIEHGAAPTEENIRMMKERNAFHVATISPTIPYGLFDREISHATYEQKENGKVVFDGVVDFANACLEAGVPVGLGTDTGCPYITHYGMWRELAFFIKYCHVTPAFAIHTATLLNAKLAGVDKITGSIEPGKMADMIVCKENPLEKLRTLQKISMVIKEGHIINKPKVTLMKSVEKEMDKFL